MHYYAFSIPYTLHDELLRLLKYVFACIMYCLLNANARKSLKRTLSRLTRALWELISYRALIEKYLNKYDYLITDLRQVVQDFIKGRLSIQQLIDRVNEVLEDHRIDPVKVDTSRRSRVWPAWYEYGGTAGIIYINNEVLNRASREKISYLIMRELMRHVLITDPSNKTYHLLNSRKARILGSLTIPSAFINIIATVLWPTIIFNTTLTPILIIPTIGVILLIIIAPAVGDISMITNSIAKYIITGKPSTT